MPRLHIAPWLQVLLLTVLALALRGYAASLDPFLHQWDEHYHALVARNMMDNPFVPTLRKGEILPAGFQYWCCNTIWLHKQPLFMWQMALSMKLFGVSEFTLRLPSVLMGTLMVPMIYHICRLARMNHFAAFTAAALHACCYYHLELVSGFYGMDHDDVAFSFYVLAAFWAYANYIRNDRWRWVVMIGVFAGCAVLCKWLTGLLVYAAWGIAVLASLPKISLKKESLRLLCSFATTTVVALPWQLYILARFPQEARYEFAFNARHIGEAIEGHTGNWRYYMDYFSRYFGDTIGWLVPAGLLLMLCAKSLDRRIRVALCSAFVLMLVFYSFIAQTKIYSYLMPAVPAGFIAIAFFADRVLSLIRRPYILRAGLSAAVVSVFCNVALQWGTLQDNHRATDNPVRQASIAHAVIFKNLQKHLQPGTDVVINVTAWEDIDLMFYNNKVTAYAWCPDAANYRILALAGKHMAIFPGPYRIPDYVLAYKGAYLLPMRIE